MDEKIDYTALNKLIRRASFVMAVLCAFFVIIGVSVGIYILDSVFSLMPGLE